jgi:hypothetical protein
LELAADAGTFAPSVGEVRTLLDQDRVRLALDRADLLSSRYRGPEAELAHGWALWRNGDVRGAQTHFRRAAEAGSQEGHSGLAAVLASSSDWEEAVRMARSALATGERIGSASAVLASAEWVAGDPRAAAREMEEWSAAEAGTARGRAAAAMAAAARRLQGAPNQWSGEPTPLPLEPLADGGWAVDASIGERRVRLKLDLAFRQSLLSSGVVRQLGLSIDGTASSAGRAASPRWPSLLAPRQTAVDSIDFDGLSLRNAVFAVAEAPAGVDGVIGADLLAGVRWSMSFTQGVLALAPAGTELVELPELEEAPAIAWLKVRLVREGVGVQFLLFPRVFDRVVAAGLDIGGTSRLDYESFVVAPGSSTAPAPLMLGGWRDEVEWRPASLTGWAVDGGVAPTAVLGANVVGGWSLHWYPDSMQLRIDSAPSDMGRRRPR